MVGVSIGYIFTFFKIKTRENEEKESIKKQKKDDELFVVALFEEMKIKKCSVKNGLSREEKKVLKCEFFELFKRAVNKKLIKNKRFLGIMLPSSKWNKLYNDLFLNLSDCFDKDDFKIDGSKGSIGRNFVEWVSQN